MTVFVCSSSARFRRRQRKNPINPARTNPAGTPTAHPTITPMLDFLGSSAPTGTSVFAADVGLTTLVRTIVEGPPAPSELEVPPETTDVTKIVLGSGLGALLSEVIGLEDGVAVGSGPSEKGSDGPGAVVGTPGLPLLLTVAKTRPRGKSINSNPLSLQQSPDCLFLSQQYLPSSHARMASFPAAVSPRVYVRIMVLAIGSRQRIQAIDVIEIGLTISAESWTAWRVP